MEGETQIALSKQDRPASPITRAVMRIVLLWTCSPPYKSDESLEEDDGDQ